MRVVTAIQLLDTIDMCGGFIKERNNVYEVNYCKEFVLRKILLLHKEGENLTD